MAEMTSLADWQQVAESLGRLRAAGWSVAVHNDYRQAGEAHTFWLFTHPNGHWIKGEGKTDAEALSIAERHIKEGGRPDAPILPHPAFPTQEGGDPHVAARVDKSPPASAPGLPSDPQWVKAEIVRDEPSIEERIKQIQKLALECIEQQEKRVADVELDNEALRNLLQVRSAPPPPAELGLETSEEMRSGLSRYIESGERSGHLSWAEVAALLRDHDRQAKEIVRLRADYARAEDIARRAHAVAKKAMAELDAREVAARADERERSAKIAAVHDEGSDNPEDRLACQIAAEIRSKP